MDTLSATDTTTQPLLLANGDFRRLWAGETVSLVGSEITTLALPLTAAVLLGASPTQMGLLTAGSTLPVLVLGLPTGVWVDRLRRRRPLLCCVQLCCAAAVLVVPVAYLLGLLTLPIVLAVTLLLGSGRVLFRTAYYTHLPDVVPDEQLTEASARFRTSESVAMLAGPGLGGVLVQALGAPLALLADSVSFAFSALAIARVQTAERLRDRPPRRRMRTEVADGLRTLLRDGRLRGIAGAAANLNFFGMGVLALLVLYVTGPLGLPPAAVGGIFVAGGCGALVGALLAPRVVRRIGEGRTIVLASAGFSVCMLALPAAGGPAPLAFAIVAAGELFAGVVIMLFDVVANGLTMVAAPRGALGRVSASMQFLSQGVKPLGALGGGVLGQAVGLRPALWVAAAGATTTVLWVWFSPLRRRSA